jgi:hypothetical protein
VIHDAVLGQIRQATVGSWSVAFLAIRLLPIRFLFGVLVVGLTLVPAPVRLYAQVQQDALTASLEANRVTDEQVREWIANLGHESFAERETASRKISRHLERSLPLLIEAAESDVSMKSEGILQFLGFVGRKAITPEGKQAYESLTRIASERTSHRAVVAQKVLENICLEMRDQAVLELRRLNATCDNRTMSVLTKKKEIRNALVIDRTFQGTDEDLELLKWLVDVQFVKLEGPKINREVLRCVAQMPRINSLQIIEADLTSKDLECLIEIPDLELLEILYTPIDDAGISILEQIPIFGDLQMFGTSLTPQGAKDLVDRMDTANVFVGRGGFLGITCEPSSLVIRDVISDGPAYQAGIRSLDKLLKIDNVPISNFDELRRELAKSASDESVQVEFERPKLYLRRRGNPGRDLNLEFNGEGKEDENRGEIFRVQVILGRRPSDMSP